MKFNEARMDLDEELRLRFECLLSAYKDEPDGKIIGLKVLDIKKIASDALLFGSVAYLEGKRKQLAENIQFLSKERVRDKGIIIKNAKKN